jgi:purine-binding chemotaxis protein CheW
VSWGRKPPSGEEGDDRARILEERAAAVARAREEPRAGGIPVVAFQLGGERFAVEVGTVFQVVDAATITPLPATPAWVLGVVLARTQVVPVLDLRALLGLQGGGIQDLSKVLVLEHDGELFGLAVEALEGRIDLDPEGLTQSGDGPFAFVAPDRLVVLDLAHVGAPSARGG